MLSVGAIRFEDRFCASRKGGTGEVGGCTALAHSAWRLLQLAIERAWSALDGPFCFLVQTSVDNGALSGRRARTVERSVMSGCGQGHEPAKNL